MTPEYFQQWRQSIQHRLPAITEELTELYLDAWQAYHVIRLQEDPGGNPSLPQLSTRGLRHLVLTDALRYELFSRLSPEQMMETEERAGERLMQLQAQICVKAGIFASTDEAVTSFLQGHFPPAARLLI
ncbi:MAG: hypothetical protein K2W95_28675 [Candidatus Obscuribacterales bacterium]|nr:hypothetical protein [Candidatus Obscuribacterales bacterium]